MRTISTDNEAVLDGAARGEWLKVEIKDSGGTFRDMTTYPGFNAVDSANWSENIDDPHATASVVLKRELEGFSISSFMEGSGANRGFVPTASFAPLIDIGREIKISVALMPADIAPASGDYILYFHGYIDAVDDAASETVTLECRDLGAKLSDVFIERERVYCIAASGQGARMWEPNTAYALNEYVIPTQTKLNAHYYKVTTAGTTHATLEPGDPGATAWPTGGGSTVTNGSVVFTEQGAATFGTGYSVEQVMQKILDDNGVVQTLYIPASPSWNITWFKQQRESTMDAIRALANQIGWDVRYKYRSGTAQFEPTLFAQTRSGPSVVRTFGATDYISIDSLKIDISGIRNVVRVQYSDAADLWPDGTPKRKEYVSSDTTSITDFGRRFMEVAESSSSNIDSSSEAQAMADAIKADLKDPVFEKQVTLVHGFPFVELGDYYTFEANGRHYDTNQSLAVVGYTHDCSGGRMRTSLTLRGLPAGGYRRWHAMDVRNRPDDSHQNTLAFAGVAPAIAVTPVVGGQRVQLSYSPDKGMQLPVEWEYHVSATASFVPSSSTIHSVTKSTEITLANLVPGKTYYTKVVPLTRNGSRLVRGSPTTETSFAAARAQAAHANSEVEWGETPLNGAFETQFDTGSPPDHWTLVTGTWATDATLTTGSAARSGGKYLEILATGVQTEIRSDYFMVEPDTEYGGRVLTYHVSGASGLWNIFVEWVDYAQANVSTETLYSFDITNNVGAWVDNQFWSTVSPSTAKFARIIVKKFSTDSIRFYVDSMRFRKTIPLPLEAVQAPSYSNSWVDFGSPQITGGYWRDPFGAVHLRGVVKDGVAATIFTLPAGYRPTATTPFPAVSNGAHCNIVITSGGAVQVTGHTNSDVSLNGIYFRTD